jgi:elongation factor 2
MPKFKTTAEALKIVHNKDQIRNLGIIAHVDHGKTTTSDSLLAACGMLSPSVAGQALALDYMELEQQRQMTIKAANVTLYYEKEGSPYVINLIDTPGHIDFTGKVTRSLRAVDGAIVVVDAVEGIMTQTDTVLRQALEERVRPVIYINKIDRLIKELRLSPEKMQDWLFNIVKEFNRLIETYAEPEYRQKWKVSIQDAQVAFGSSKDRWGFNFDMARAAGMSFKDIINAYSTSTPESLGQKLPLHEALLGMVVRHHPPPHVAQTYRIPKIWPQGDLKSDVGKSLLACDENGPTVMMVTNVVVDPAAGLVETLLRKRVQWRPCLSAKFQTRGQDPVGSDLHGVPEGDSRLVARRQHPGASRARRTVGGDDIQPKRGSHVRIDPLRQRASRDRRSRGQASQGPPQTG